MPQNKHSFAGFHFFPTSEASQMAGSRLRGDITRKHTQTDIYLKYTVNLRNLGTKEQCAAADSAILVSVVGRL